jgi:hypothetical protein
MLKLKSFYIYVFNKSIYFKTDFRLIKLNDSKHKSNEILAKKDFNHKWKELIRYYLCCNINDVFKVRDLVYNNFEETARDKVDNIAAIDQKLKLTIDV